MQVIIALCALAVLVALAAIAAMLRTKKTAPDAPIVAVRSGARRWTPFSGCLRDAQTEGWVWAADKSDNIIEAATGRRTGRVLRKFGKH